VGSTIAVYDLGGGTFDAAIVRKVDERAFSLLGTPQGIDRLGGIDFDQAVFGHVSASTSIPPIDPTDPDAMAAMLRLRRECTEAKEALSADTDATIPVLLPQLRTRVRLVRAEFEDLVRDAVEETVDALQVAIDSAGVELDEVDAVLLVGGSSRIPLIAQVISSRLRRPIVVDADPKTSIALGAATMAASAVRPLAEPRSPQPVVAVPTVRRDAALAARTAPSRPAPAPQVMGTRRRPAKIGVVTVAASVAVAAVAGAAIAVVWPDGQDNGRPAVVEARFNPLEGDTSTTPGPQPAGSSSPTSAQAPRPAAVPPGEPAVVPTPEPLLNPLLAAVTGATQSSAADDAGSSRRTSLLSAITAAVLPIPLAEMALQGALSSSPITGAGSTAPATTAPLATVPGAGITTETAPSGTAAPTAAPTLGSSAPTPQPSAGTTSPPATNTPSGGPTTVDPPPADNPPADNPPADNPPADNPPVDQQPIDDPPADNPPAEQGPVDTTSADSLPAVEPQGQREAEPASDPVAAEAMPSSEPTEAP
ncbi:MAG: Hsp70 family protein, partial [Ilumatobacteraceae bacterium]